MFYIQNIYSQNLKASNIDWIKQKREIYINYKLMNKSIWKKNGYSKLNSYKNPIILGHKFLIVILIIISKLISTLYFKFQKSSLKIMLRFQISSQKEIFVADTWFLILSFFAVMAIYNETTNTITRKLIPNPKIVSNSPTNSSKSAQKSKSK